MMDRKVDKPFHENLAALLERELPGPSVSSKDDGQVDCGICYAQYLPVGNVSYACRLIIHFPAEYISNLIFLKTMNLELTAEVHRTIPAKILVAVKLFIPYASEIGCIPLQQRGSVYISASHRHRCLLIYILSSCYPSCLYVFLCLFSQVI